MGDSEDTGTKQEGVVEPERIPFLFNKTEIMFIHETLKIVDDMALRSITSDPQTLVDAKLVTATSSKVRDAIISGIKKVIA